MKSAVRVFQLIKHLQNIKSDKRGASETDVETLRMNAIQNKYCHLIYSKSNNKANLERSSVEKKLSLKLLDKQCTQLFDKTMLFEQQNLTLDDIMLLPQILQNMH